MRKRRQDSRRPQERPEKKAARAPSIRQKGSRTQASAETGRTTRATKEKRRTPDDHGRRKGVGAGTVENREVREDRERSEAEGAFYSLPRLVRDRLRKKYHLDGTIASYNDWLTKGTDKYAKKARRVRAKNSGQAFAGLSDKEFRKAAGIVPLTLGKMKMLNRELRKQLLKAKLPKNPYVASMAPIVIVPDDPEAKPVIADAGTILKLCDQNVAYRDSISPITRRADEILVKYGKADKPTLGWITHKLPDKALKPTTGPTFLVTTRAEDALIAWEQIRLKIARTRKSDPSSWLASWLGHQATKHPAQLREAVRFFGGKPIKNEAIIDRCIKLVSLILHTEIDATMLKSSKKTRKNVKTTQKPAKRKAVATESTKGEFTARSRAFDRHVIKRLVKENPRRAGSGKAVIWGYLKKGMTVAEFVKKGGSRGAVQRYIQSGWAKLLRPKSTTSD